MNLKHAFKILALVAVANFMGVSALAEDSHKAKTGESSEFTCSMNSTRKDNGRDISATSDKKEDKKDSTKSTVAK
jgi:hypothetical protein